MSLKLYACLVLGTALASSFFADVAAAEEPKMVRLAITPASESLPALKYQLLPPFSERRAGNAALEYGRAFAGQSPHDAKFELEWTGWLDLSPAEFARATQGRDLAALRGGGRIELVHLGARCDRCDWQLPLREQPFYAILLPHLSEMRQAGRIAALNVRLNVQEKNYAEALRWLQTGYALARHAAEEPTLVSGLVGVSIAAIMDKARLALLQQPDAPSLYWAETFLPRPFIDGRPGIETEMHGVSLSFAGLRAGKRSPEEWNADAQKLLIELPMLMALSSEESTSTAQFAAVLSTLKIMAQVTLRRQELQDFVVRCGETEQDAKPMGDAQLLLVFTRLKYEALRDDMFRWFSLPYAEARSGIEEAEQRLREEKQNPTEIIPLGAMILPAVSAVKHNYARADRRRDVLRILEALRLYAGKHDGKLPASLDDVKEVPVPKLDAVTGRAFDYVLHDGTARLTLPEEQRGSKTPLVYEITVAAKK